MEMCNNCAFVLTMMTLVFFFTIFTRLFAIFCLTFVSFRCLLPSFVNFHHLSLPFAVFWVIEWILLLTAQDV